MTPIDRIHGDFVHTRRGRVLSTQIAALLPAGSSVLDVGCGDGLLGRLLRDRASGCTITGVDVLVRPEVQIPVAWFDGYKLPHADHSVDVVLFVDVLHHTDDPNVLLREAARVARHSVIIKDHLMEGFLAEHTLSFMDRVANRRHGIALPHNYWRKAQWTRAFAELGLAPSSWSESLGLYQWPASCIFGRSLHFLARLDRTNVPG